MNNELIKAQVEWSPRSGNTEADALANGVHEGFDPNLRLQNALTRGERPNRAVKQRKRKPQERMRVTDPW